MRYGIREICDVVLRAKSTMKLGDKVFYKDEPVIRFDTLKTSSLEGAATSVYAQGGRGNARLVAWEGERTLTFTMEDALLTPESFAILSGARMKETISNYKGEKPYLIPLSLASATGDVFYDGSLCLGNWTIDTDEDIEKFATMMSYVKTEEDFQKILDSLKMNIFTDGINILDGFNSFNPSELLTNYTSMSSIMFLLKNEGPRNWQSFGSFEDCINFLNNFKVNNIKQISIAFDLIYNDNYVFATAAINYWDNLDLYNCNVYLEADPYGVLENKEVIRTPIKEKVVHALDYLEIPVQNTDDMIIESTYVEDHGDELDATHFRIPVVFPEGFTPRIIQWFDYYSWEGDDNLDVTMGEIIYNFEPDPIYHSIHSCSFILKENLYTLNDDDILNFEAPGYIDFMVVWSTQGTSVVPVNDYDLDYSNFQVDYAYFKTNGKVELKQVFKPALPYYNKIATPISNSSANLVHRTQILHFNNTTESAVKTAILSKIPMIDKATACIMKLDANNEIDTEPYPIFNDNVSLNAWSWSENNYYLLDYYEVVEKVKTLTIEPDHFSSNFYLEASTLFRDTRGTDHPAEFVIPNCKVQSNFTLSMASSGDPSTFTFTLDAFPGYARFNPGKKVLASVQLLDNVNLNDLKRDRTSHNPAHEGLITF